MYMYGMYMYGDRARQRSDGRGGSPRLRVPQTTRMYVFRTLPADDTMAFQVYYQQQVPVLIVDRASGRMLVSGSGSGRSKYASLGVGRRHQPTLKQIGYSLQRQTRVRRLTVFSREQRLQLGCMSDLRHGEA